jgi:hypothetical protein
MPAATATPEQRPQQKYLPYCSQSAKSLLGALRRIRGQPGPFHSLPHKFPGRSTEPRHCDISDLQPKRTDRQSHTSHVPQQHCSKKSFLPKIYLDTMRCGRTARKATRRDIPFRLAGRFLASWLKVLLDFFILGAIQCPHLRTFGRVAQGLDGTPLGGLPFRNDSRVSRGLCYLI